MRIVTSKPRRQVRRTLSRRSPLRIEPLEIRTLLASDIVITEFVANSRLGIRDDDGVRSDWIEVFNAGNQPVNLSGYYLTDDAQDFTKWQFPDRVLDAQSYEVVFASGQDRKAAAQPLHTNFRLSSDGETVMLVEPDGQTVADSHADYPVQREGVSFGSPQRIESSTALERGSAAKFLIPTAEGAEFDATWQAAEYDDSNWNDGLGGIGYDPTDRWTEFIDSDIQDQMQNINTTALLRYSFQMTDVAGIVGMQLQMQYDDGFVAYLNGVEVARRLAPEELTYDARASASRPNDEKASVDQVDVSEFASELVAGTNVLAIHGLNRSIRSSFFVSPALTFDRPGDVINDQGRYFAEPTPGKPNGDISYAGVLDTVDVSVTRGFYETAQDVVVTGANAGASIVYTMDGSTPSADNGTIVPPPDADSPATANIAIASTTTLRATAVKEDFLSAPPATNTYVFVGDVITQSPDGAAPEGWPSRPINGQRFTYGMDPEVVEDPQYAPLIQDALRQVSSISLVTDQHHLFDEDTGIFVNAEEARGNNAAWERPTSVELIHPDGTQGFQIDAGFRIRGGASRRPDNAKHAFRLFFRAEYGETKLRYPMFGDEGVDEFDNIDLRSPSLPSWHWCNLGHPRWGCKRSTFLRDIFGRDSQRDVGLPYTRSQYYHLYLNGQYWGLFQSQERPEASYAESYFGGDKSDYDVVKVEGPPRRVEATDGTIDAWRQLWEMAGSGFESDEAYFRAQGRNPDGTRNPEFPVLLNVENLVDYIVIQFYTGNWDGPISDNIDNRETNNWYGILDREGDTGFQFFVHDGEYMLFDVETNRLGPWTAGDTFEHSNPQWLHQQLVKNERYREYFGDRAFKHLFHDGAFTPENSRARLLTRMNEIDLAIIAESARWGDSNRGRPFTKEDWLTEVDWILETFFPQRTDIVIDQFKNSPVGAASDLIAPILSSTPAPTFSQRGGPIEDDLALSMSAPDKIYFTLDGSDPREHAPVVDFQTLVASGDSLRFHVPTDDSASEQWMLPEFDDTAWSQAVSSIGFEESPGQLEGAIQTNISESMLGTNSSVYVRIPFSVDNPADIEVLELAMQYDDAFVAYLNGIEVARSNLRSDPEWNSRARARRESNVEIRAFETVDLTDQLALIQAGNNVLAIQGVNRMASDDDFFLLPELRAGQITDIGSSPSAREYVMPVPLNESTIVSARALRGHQWSPINQVTFHDNATPVEVSEIMYHPAGPTPADVAAGFTDDDDFEYIEVRNTAEEASLDLNGVIISGAIEFTFPLFELGPGDRAVVARNTAAFQTRYGTGARIAGQYGDARLSNDSESIKLSDRFGVVIQEFTYDDSWYPATDGDGYSLERVEAEPQADLSSPHAWRSSYLMGGSPGRPDQLPGDVNRDGVFNSADLVQVFQIGEYEDNEVGNSTFDDGDWDGDGEFNSRDLVLVFQLGLFQINAANVFVAEPGFNNPTPPTRIEGPIGDDVTLETERWRRSAIQLDTLHQSDSK